MRSENKDALQTQITLITTQHVAEISVFLFVRNLTHKSEMLPVNCQDNGYTRDTSSLLVTSNETNYFFRFWEKSQLQHV